MLAQHPGSAQRPATRNRSQLQQTTHLTGAQLPKGSARCSRNRVYLRSSCSASACSVPDTRTQGWLSHTGRDRALCSAQHGVLRRWTWRSMRSTHAAGGQTGGQTGGQITEASCQAGCALYVKPHTCGCTADAAKVYQPPRDKQQTGISSRMILT